MRTISLFFFTILCVCVTTEAAQERLWLDSKINGKPARMMFDSGANGLFLTKQGAQRLGLKFSPPPADSDPPLGVTEPCELTVLESTFKVRMLVMEFPAHGQPEGDGVLGWEPLRNNIFFIDASAQSIRLLKTISEEVKTSWVKLSVRTNSDVLTLEIPESKRNLVIFVDTGDDSGVSLLPRSWREWKTNYRDQPSTLNSYFMPGAGLVAKEESWAAQLTFGPISLTELPVAEANLEQIRLVGGEGFGACFGLTALKNFDLVVDGKQGVAYIRSKKTPPTPYEHNRLGAVFMPRDLAPQDSESAKLVARVADNSPAQEAGIKDNDVLLKIGELDVTKWPSDSSLKPNVAFRTNPAGTKFELTLQRDESTFKVNVVLRDILGPKTSSATNDSVVSAMNTNGLHFKKPFRFGSDEAYAAFLGTECAALWFASESKALKKDRIDKRLLSASILTRALNVNYTEKQFRNALEKRDHMFTNFVSSLSDMIEKEKNGKIRDIYLYSFWCTASRIYGTLIPVFPNPERAKVTEEWVTRPLDNARKVASIYDQGLASSLGDLSARSLSEPLNTFDSAEKFAAEIMELQKAFLLKFLTKDEAKKVVEPILERKP